MRLSTGLANRMLDTSCLKEVFDNCIIDIYSGAQPTLPDSIPNGTLLCTVSKASGAITAEAAAVGTVTLTGGAAGSVNTITVNSIDILGGAVAFNASLTQTAADVALQINRNPKNALYLATSAGAVVTLTAVNGLGTLPNGWVVTATLTTITASYANMAGGVDCVNGLRWDVAAGGVISKLTADTWSGNGLATGTAGWFRIRQSSEAGTTSSTTAPRIDGSIGTSGADLNLGSLTVSVGAPFILSTAAITLPQQ